MARKFGAKYSPGTGRPAEGTHENRFSGGRVSRSGFRVNLLFFLPIPLLFAGIGELNLDASGSLTAMLANFAAFGLLLLAAWLLRDGLKAQIAYEESKVARPPAIPRKLFASVLTGLGISVAAWGSMGAGLVAAVVYGGLAGLAHSISFGLDPMRKKGLEGFNEFETDRVARAVEKAEKLLAETLSAAGRFRDRTLEGRVERLAATVRDMLRTVENDPRDLTAARKFLTVYLKGARDATVKYAELDSRARGQDAREDYENLLNDLEHSFQAQREKLLLDDRSDLEVEIEVLRDRLNREGLKT